MSAPVKYDVDGRVMIDGQSVVVSYANGLAFTASGKLAVNSIGIFDPSRGYEPPVAYTAGLQMLDASQTVEYLGQVYAPVLADLPFTTSGTFETAKFRLIQGVAGVDLLAPGGALMVGYDGTSSGLSATTVQAAIDEVKSTSIDTNAASLTPAAGKIPVARADGEIDAAWVGATELPAIKPSLLLDFANSKVVDPRITYACASQMPYYDGCTVVKAEENLLLNSASLATQTRAVTATAHTLSFSGTGTVTLTGASTAGPLVGTGPDRVVLSFTPTAGNLTLTVSGDVLEAQLEARSFATAYTPTTTQPITRYQPKLLEAPANVPTITHDPVTGETLGSQVYGQATNLLTRSDDFTNAEWVKTNVDPVSGVIAPDGTVSGSILRETTATGAHGVERSITVNIGETRTLLFVAKNFGRRYVTVSFASVNLACFDLQEGTAVIGAGSANSVALTPTIRNLGNGLFLCAAKLTRLNTNLTATIEIRASRTLLTASTDSYTGDGTSGIYIWRAGLYAGDYAGPPTKTEGSQVTRAAVTQNSIATAPFYNPAEGTFYIEVDAEDINDQGIILEGFSVSPTTDTRNFFIGRGGNSAISSAGKGFGLAISMDSGNQYRAFSSALAGRVKIAMSYSQTEPPLFVVNGSLVTTSTLLSPSPQPLPLSTITFNNRAGGASAANTCKHLKDAYYPKRMTATELEALTS